MGKTLFLSFEEQLNKLELEKNLVISDREYAENVLHHIGYFALINGYKEPFKNPTTKKYRDGTKFEDIVALYEFDESLREIFLKYILRIERHIRSLLSYYFTEKYGEQQKHYLNSSNYITSDRYKAQVSRLINILKNLANQKSDYPYINHQREVNHNVPLWVLVNGLTFGSLSKFYEVMTQDLKIKISQNFNNVNEKQLEQFLNVVKQFRNVCAHNERLFSYKVHKDIPDTALHKKLCIPQKGEQYLYGKRDLFAVVIAFRYLLPNDDFKEFKKKLTSLIANYQKSSHSINESDLLDMMGFPENWKKITLYKK